MQRGEYRDLDAAVEAAEGIGGIDIMVNNAGIFREEDFFEVTEEDIRRPVRRER